jgi:CBS-domain-containing membrane protein
MRVEEALSTTITPLHASDSVEDALADLMEHRVRHLPVVDDADLLVGIVSEEQLIQAPDAEAEVGDLVDPRAPVSAHPDDHIFDAARVMVDHDLSTLPVTRRGQRFVGLVRRHEIFDRFARMLATQEPGAILALEVDPRDYALAKLVHVIEQNGAKVRAVASESPEDSTSQIRVTLKLNVTDTTRIRHVLEHHGYDIVASFGAEDDEILERAQEFMRYLEV